MAIVTFATSSLYAVVKDIDKKWYWKPILTRDFILEGETLFWFGFRIFTLLGFYLDYWLYNWEKFR